MANPGNWHCTNWIGVLSFPGALLWSGLLCYGEYGLTHSVFRRSECAGGRKVDWT